MFQQEIKRSTEVNEEIIIGKEATHRVQYQPKEYWVAGNSVQYRSGHGMGSNHHVFPDKIRSPIVIRTNVDD
jgi:hypothetical protein